MLSKTTAKENFFKDLVRGKIVESVVLKHIQKKYPSSCIIDAFKGYDIWIPELHKSIEVKYDPMSNETGNILIEFEFDGKPSALMTTKADWWVFHDGSKFYMYEPMNIVYAIFLNKLQYVSIVGNGDIKEKKCFLIKKDEFFKHGRELKWN